MRRRAAPAPGRLGLPRLSPAHQRLRPAHRHRRAGALRPGADGRRDLRAVAAARPWRAGAGALRLRRRPVRGHRHADRRDRRHRHHGLQRPGDAGAAAPPGVRPPRQRRPDAAPAQHPPRRHRRRADARLPLLPHRRRSLRPGQHRPDQLRRGRPVRPGPLRRHVLARRHAHRCAGRAPRRLRRLGLHPDAALGGAVGLDAGRVHRERPLRHRVPGAGTALRPRGARQPHPVAVLEPPGQRRPLCRPFALAPARGARGEPGAPLRRRVRAGSLRRRRHRADLLAGARPPRRPLRAREPPPRPGPGAVAVRGARPRDRRGRGRRPRRRRATGGPRRAAGRRRRGQRLGPGDDRVRRAGGTAGRG